MSYTHCTNCNRSPITLARVTPTHQYTVTDQFQPNPMNKRLPRFLLFTDPYHSIQDRVLIMRAHEPRYIFEINYPEDAQAHFAQRVTVEDQTYLVAVRRRLSYDEPQIPLSHYNDVARWYHYAKGENSGKQ